MNDKLENSLQAYLDGTLAPKAAQALEKRLGEPAVARRLAALRALREGLVRSAPRLSPADSRRLWVGIRAQVLAQPMALPQPGWFERVFAKRWVPAWGVGLVGAAAALWLLLLRPVAPPPTVSPLAAGSAQAKAALAPSPARALARRGAGIGPAPAPAPAFAPVAARAAARSDGPSVVEQALAANPVDDLIEQALQAPRVAAPMRGGSLAGFDQVSAVEAPVSVDSQALTRAQGQPDANGFWDWKPAALALNQHQWGQARIELQAAGSHAASASERAFADSALGLLAGVGGPLEGTQSPIAPTGDLRIVGAGRWQLQVDARQARFVQGVSARLPGLRVEGAGALMDLTFDRVSFAPGTRFTRVAGDGSTKVLDAADQAVADDEFSAPAGADYNVAEHVLRLR